MTTSNQTAASPNPPASRLRSWAALCAGLALAGASWAQGQPAAGSVVFVSGPARLVAADGTTKPLENGAQVRQGEQVITGVDGYAHVRMIDNAFVAVRPDSRLSVELYEYDAANPAASRIKLQLLTGNARTVSGKGGQAAKQNYRFNTPMAAIGLRGTDYTVVSTDDSTRVSVSQGAVAVTPLGTGCAASSLGPCATNTTRELNSTLAHAYMEVSARNIAPVLVRPEQDPHGGAGQNPSGRPEEPRAESRADLKIAGSKDAASQVTADQLATGLNPTPPPPPRVFDLVWGRWSSYAQGEGAPAMATLLNPQREIVVGSDIFGLLRPTGAVTLPGQGSYDFKMAGSEAYTLTQGVVGSAQVTGGSFGIDFNQRTFNTALSVQHGAGVEQLSAQGAVQWQGLLIADRSRSNMSLDGAVASGGTEAAYLFSKQLASGGLLGAVRWVR